MYYSCHCIKRNGLQHDCRRTGCGGEPTCLVLPDPLCAPSQLARARGLADPAPLAPHYRAQAGGGPAGGAASSSAGGSGGGKRFIVCELKGIIPDLTGASAQGSKSHNSAVSSVLQYDKCCKCHQNTAVSNVPHRQALPDHCICAPTATKIPLEAYSGLKSTPYATGAQGQSTLVRLDQETVEAIIKRFKTKDMADHDVVVGPGGRVRKVKPKKEEEPCTRPGCVHWKPPPPCLWDAPCKADCFEAHPGIQPGRNPLTGSGGFRGMQPGGSQGQRMKLLTPDCCT